jgi:hypothetical protein
MTILTINWLDKKVMNTMHNPFAVLTKVKRV